MTAMVDVGAVAGNVLAVLGAALVFGTALAVAAWLLSITVLRRARPAVIAALWTVVLLKFLVPIGPGARYSLASLVDTATRDTPAIEMVVVTAPAPGATLGPAPAPTAPWGTLAAAGAWVAIAAALTGRQIRRARAARQHALAADPAPAWLTDEAAALGRRLRLRRPVALRVSAIDGAAYLVGLLRPIIVLPAALVADATAAGIAARRAALAHELAHVRRGDAALRLVQAAAATVFFFWPVVRLVNRRLDLAREQACDAWAIAVGPLAARDYARMLVDAARASAAPAAGLALARRGGQLRRRVEALCARPPGAGVGAAGVLVIAGFALLGLTGAAPVGAAAAAPRVCLFTPEVASSIMASFPEADTDNDGALSRAEVCEFQHVMRRRVVESPFVLSEAAQWPSRRIDLSATDPRVVGDMRGEGAALASDSLCCDCPAAVAAASLGAVSTRDAVEVSNANAIPTCSRGVDP